MTKGYDGDGNSFSSSQRRGRALKTNQNSFKLSLLETNNDKTKINLGLALKKDDEEAEFIQFLKY